MSKRWIDCRVAAVLLVLALATACLGPRDVIERPRPSANLSTFTLVGQFAIPPLTRFPPAIGLRFGGISGVAATSRGVELLGITDEQDGPRVYRFRISGEGTAFRVETVNVIPLDGIADGPSGLDPESIAILPNGNLLIASEGLGNTAPRLPPALFEFGAYGDFIRRLPLRDRYVPNPTGPLVKGVRPNRGLESLTIVPGGRRIFTATESSIVQDGELTTFERGTPARLLEYVRHGDTYAPTREFAYMVEPIGRPTFEPGIADNGLVELLALDSKHLLALERSFVQDAGNTGLDVNRIRLFRVTLEGATDVSSFDSLKDAAGYVPVRKELVLDLSNVPGLSPELAPSLDNFEALAFGPVLSDGRSSLVVVSDDNFNKTQRTWFLLFAIGHPSSSKRIQ